MFCDLMKQNLNEECLVNVIGLNEGVKACVCVLCISLHQLCRSVQEVQA